MRNTVNICLKKLKSQKKAWRKTLAVWMVLSLLVSGAVTWKLHLTGISMTGDEGCGLQEHIHKDSCYEERLVCGKSEGFEPVIELDDLYLSNQMEDEIERTSDPPLSDEEETEHVHTEECYEKVLICDLPEHEHSLQCYPDPDADVESEEDWKETLPEELAGNWQEDLMEVAKSQLGYTESVRNFVVDEEGKRGYSRYGQWYGNPYGDWNTMFAAFCLHYAGLKENEDIPVASGSDAWVVALEEAGLYLPSDELEEDTVGNLMFLDLDEDGKADRTSIVIGMTESAESLVTVEGDLDDSVSKAEYALDDSSILGFGFLPEQLVSSEDEISSLPSDSDKDKAETSESQIKEEKDDKDEGREEAEQESQTADPVEQVQQPVMSSGISLFSMPMEVEQTEISIVIDWSDGSDAHAGKSVEVDVVNENGEVVNTVRVSSSDNWQKYVSVDSGHTYSIVEHSVNSYISSVSSGMGEGSTVTWQQVSSLTPGEKYAITYVDENDSTVTRAINNEVNADTLNGYPITLTNGVSASVPDTALWIYGTDGTLLNVATQKYIYKRNASSEWTASSANNRSITFSNGKISTVIGFSTRYLRNSSSSANSSSNATTYTVFQQTIEQVPVYTITYSKILSPSDPEANPEEIEFAHNKTIDAFRDGTDNPDTNLDNDANVDRTDLYRLYLDVNGQDPVNILFVIDFSGSMADTSTDYAMDGKSRYQTMLNVMTAEDTIIDTICQNPDNRISFVTFSSYQSEYRAETLGSWTSDSTQFKNELKAATTPIWATNYERGLELAEMQYENLFAAEPEREDYTTYLIFIGDGAATEYLTGSDSSYDGYLPHDDGYVSGTNYSATSQWGYTRVDSRSETARVTNFVFPHTSAYIEQYKAEHSEWNFYSIAFSNKDMSQQIDNTNYTFDQLLKQLAQDSGTFSPAGSEEALTQVLGNILTVRGTNLVITDKLSDYVDFHEQPDILVTMKDRTTGEKTYLYQNGAVTEAGNGILQQVVVDQDTKTIQAVFEPDYIISSRYTLTLSFNVQTTQQAYQEFAQSGYNAIGSNETDYGSNTTSSGQKGFFSNADANILYMRNGQYWQEAYNYPVVQAVAGSLVLHKQSANTGNSLVGAQFDLYKPAMDGESVDYSYLGVNYTKVNDTPYEIADPSGNLVIGGLYPGNYLLIEVKAPDGYHLLKEPVRFSLDRRTVEIDGDFDIEASHVVINNETLPMLKISNTSDGVFPETGGIGPEFVTAAGAVLMTLPVLAGYTCSRRRRRE